MKRATVSIHLTATGEYREVEGYLCEIEGLELVVHRTCLGLDGGGAPILSSKQWTVTEPRTGRSIVAGISTRRLAILLAREEIECQGGAQAVERQVAALADAEGQLLTMVSEKEREKRELVAVYATAIRTNATVDWAKVNAAIIKRWSKTALRDIKRQAWEIVHQKDQPTSQRAA